MVIDLSNPDLGEHTLRALGDGPRVCFWCMRPLTAISVFWSGERRIFFHPGCSREFALALLYDGQRAEALIDGRRIDAGMTSAVAAAKREAETPQPVEFLVVS